MSKDLRDLNYEVINQDSVFVSNFYEIELEGIKLHKLDSMTSLHQIKVSKLCLEMGKKMGLSPQELKTLVKAANIYDIGKMAVSQELQSLPRKLTPKEFDEMKQHVTRGVALLEAYNKTKTSKEDHIPDEVIKLVGEHHERLDGSGYPKGLSGKQINLQSRILAVADMLGALTAKRYQREAMSLKDAFAILDNDVKNGKLDATVVKTAKEICQEREQLKQGKVKDSRSKNITR